MNTLPGLWRCSSIQALTKRCTVGYEPPNPARTSASCRRWAVRFSFLGRWASSSSIASSTPAHAPITGERFGRVLYFGRVTFALQILRYGVARGTQPPRDLADTELVHSVPASNLADRLHADHSRLLRKLRSLSGCSLLRDHTASNLLSFA